MSAQPTSPTAPTATTEPLTLMHKLSSRELMLAFFYMLLQGDENQVPLMPLCDAAAGLVHGFILVITGRDAKKKQLQLVDGTTTTTQDYPGEAISVACPTIKGDPVLATALLNHVIRISTWSSWRKELFCLNKPCKYTWFSALSPAGPNFLAASAFHSGQVILYDLVQRSEHRVIDVVRPTGLGFIPSLNALAISTYSLGVWLHDSERNHTHQNCLKFPKEEGTKDSDDDDDGDKAPPVGGICSMPNGTVLAVRSDRVHYFEPKHVIRKGNNKSGAEEEGQQQQQPAATEDDDPANEDVQNPTASESRTTPSFLTLRLPSAGRKNGVIGAVGLPKGDFAVRTMKGHVQVVRYDNETEGLEVVQTINVTASSSPVAGEGIAVLN